MSPTRSGYKELGLDLVEPLQDQPRKTRRPPMVEENKDEGARDPFKMLLEEALEWQRDAMMDNFAQILWRLPTGDASSFNNHSWGATPFKVQVNFDIPIFEGLIDEDAIDKWLNLLEGYFSIHDFSNQKILLLYFLKLPHMSRIGGKPTVNKRTRVNPHCFQPHPLGIIYETPSRNNITLSRAMKKNT